MKPRITRSPFIQRVQGASWWVAVWWCKGRGVVGHGTTPERAYEDWLASLRERDAKARTFRERRASTTLEAGHGAIHDITT